MKLELDHFFIMVDPGAKVADLLIALGMKESFSRDHAGQGTSNRRFEFSNSMLELLWVRDADEAIKGPGKKLNFVERFNRSDASPFGIILNRKGGNECNMPFEGWTYQPDYFEPPLAFHAGVNSSNVLEPLCIYVPFMKSPERHADEGVFRSVSHVKITTTANPLSEVIKVVNSADRVSVVSGEEHLMQITLDDSRQGMSKDFRPELPLVVSW